MTYLHLIFLSLLIIISIIDFKAYVIPNWAVLGLLILSLIKLSLNGYIMQGLITGGIICITMASVRHIGTRIKKTECVGAGDIKLATVLGMTLTIYQMGVFFILTGVFGLAFAAYFNRKKHARLFPFGPALCLGYVVTHYLNF